MVAGLGAQVHYRCELKTSPPSGNLESLTYGLFASAEEARKRFGEGLDFEFSEGAELCSKSVRDRMREILSEGESTCFVDAGGEYLAIWWNGNGSRRLHELHFDPSTKPEEAVQDWERILSKG